MLKPPVDVLLMIWAIFGVTSKFEDPSILAEEAIIRKNSTKGSRLYKEAKEFIRRCHFDARVALKNGCPHTAWSLLAKAHIVSQPFAVLHMKAHWWMLVLAFQTMNLREIFGQVLRMSLAAIGSLTGSYPKGNTGLSNISAFQEMEIPDELKFLVPSSNSTADPKAPQAPSSSSKFRT